MGGPFGPRLFVQRLDYEAPPVQLVIALGPAVVAIVLALVLYLAFTGWGLL